ncbi:MAG: hypothetical protein JOZ44_14315 [Acidobacteria bacterium]|nr:hypothetical protein [Acidobacteriota bacterium]
MRSQLTIRSSLIALLLFSSLSGFPEDALHLFRKMQAALGGADKIASIQDFEEIVRADAWHDDGRPMGVVRKRVRFIRPSYLRIDQVGSEDTYVLYFNGSSGWEILPDGRVADLAGEELRFAEHYVWGFDLNLWLADRNPRSAITSPVPNVIAITDRENASMKEEFALDVSSFLPAKVGSFSAADSTHPASRETRLESWHTFAGVKFPQRTSSFHNGIKVTTITVELTKVNQGLKPAGLSAKPADLKPVISQHE